MEIIDAGRVRIGVSATRIDGIDYVDVRVHKTDGTGLMRPTPSDLLDAMQREKDAAEQFESRRSITLKNSQTWSAQRICRL